MTEELKEIPLPFETGDGGSFPVQYNTSYIGNTYYIRYRDGYVTIEQNNCEVFEQALFFDELDGLWTDEETNVYLMLISNAIINNTLNTLKLPTIEEAPLHKFYKRGMWPKYLALDCKEEHRHDNSCPHKTVPAKELDESSYKKIKQFYDDYRKRNNKR